MKIHANTERHRHWDFRTSVIQSQILSQQILLYFFLNAQGHCHEQNELEAYHSTECYYGICCIKILV